MPPTIKYVGVPTAIVAAVATMRPAATKHNSPEPR